jgi:DHA2 family multidrug resistance protein
MSQADKPVNVGAVVVSLMLATLMNTLDSTIANVALPHIQGSLSAPPDEVVWVLTSYIVAAAMTTPVSGWMANRFGLKRVFIIAVAGFTVSSALCGLSTSLPELVLFRAIQGACGAFTMPLGQTLLFAIYPPSRHAYAMSIWAAGAMVGPLLGPPLGGYITDLYSWRWCFLINLPVGVLAVAGLWIFVPSQREAAPRRLDWAGFLALIMGVGGLQLMLDRGPGRDWFSSSEIWVYALTAAIAFWVFLAHTLTTREAFVPSAIFRDENMIGGGLVVFMAMALMFGSMALLPQMTQGLMSYSVLLSGLSNAPRGVGMLLAMFAMPWLMERLGPRPVMLLGVGMSDVGLWQMAHFDLSMGVEPILMASFWQGLGQGFLSVPTATIALSTLPASFRAEAASLYNLLRSMGSSIGISTLQALAIYQAQASHEAMAAQAQPADPMFRWAAGAAYAPDALAGKLALNAEITRQATMVGYIDDFRLMFVGALACVPVILLVLRSGQRAKPGVEALSD